MDSFLIQILFFYENHILYVGDEYCIQLFQVGGGGGSGEESGSGCGRGNFIQKIGGSEYGEEEGEFNMIKGLCVMGDRLFVTDLGNSRVQVFKTIDMSQ